MEKSESIKNLALALSKAQSEVKNAVKDSNNPFFKSKYADLTAVWDACRDVLAKYELSICQMPSGKDGKMALETVLMHSSGEFVSNSFEMTPSKNDPQGIGSAITYARRYALAAFVGIATEDDDGNAASHGKEVKPKKNPKITKLWDEGCQYIMNNDEGIDYNNIKRKFLAYVGECGFETSDISDNVENLTKVVEYIKQKES